MRYILVFVQFIIFIKFYETKHNRIFDVPEDSNKNPKSGHNDDMDKEIAQGLEQIVKIMQTPQPTFLRRFPTIRIIRRGPINIEPVTTLDKPDDFLPENTEIIPRRIILRKNRQNNNFPMVLGPFPVRNFMSRIKLNKINLDKESEFEREIEKKLLPSNINFPPKDEINNNFTKIKIENPFDTLDNILEKNLEDFIFGAMKKLPSNSIDNNNYTSHQNHIIHNQTEKHNVINHQLPPVNLNHNLVTPHLNYTQKHQEIQDLIKQAEKDLMADFDKKRKDKEQINKSSAIQNTSKFDEKSDIILSDFEKLEREELQKISANETGVFNFILKKINSDEKKNLYISISILMLMIFIVIIILCNYISTRKAASRNNRDTKFLNDINDNKYY